MYRQNGTANGIRNTSPFSLGIDVEVMTPFTGTTRMLVQLERGADRELGPADRFVSHAFDVGVDAPVTTRVVAGSGASGTTSSPPTPSSWT